jgi:hydrogenase maturation protease
MTAVVIGVGNVFRHDDGAGLAVIERLERLASPVPGLRLAITDGEPARLLELWSGAEVAVVVDAVHNHAVSEPGRIHRLVVDRPLPAEPGAASSHGLGLGAAVDLAIALDRMPRRLVLLAVEGADFSVGLGLSSHVAAALDRLVVEVLAAVGAPVPGGTSQAGSRDEAEPVR